MKINVFLYICLILFSCFNIKAQTEQEDRAEENQIKAAYFLKTLQEHYKNGEYQLHKDYSDSLQNIGEKHNLTRMYIVSLINKGVYYNNNSEQHKSIQLYHNALEKCELIPEDFKIRTVVLVNMANTYHHIRSYKKAIDIMNEVLTVANNTEGGENIKAAALIGLANNYAELKEYDKVLEFAQKAKTVGELINNESTIATALNSLSDTYYHQGKYLKAIKAAEKALDLNYLKTSTKNKAWILLNLGASHLKLGHLDRALNYLKKAKKIAIDKNLKAVEMHCYEYSAVIYEQKGDFKKSHIEQKKYTEANNLFLKNSNEALKLDLNKNIKDKNEELANSKETISDLGKKRNQTLLLGGLLFLTLSSLLFIYIKRKKNIEKEQIKLREQYTSLKKTVSDTENKNQESEKTKNTSAYKNSSLTPEDRNIYKEKIVAYMNQQRPYLDYNLNQSLLAEKLELSSHHFSEVLYFCFEQNFYNFINSYRILEAQKLIKSTKHQDSKILAIAFESGFKSKTSFNRIFKMHTGLTPTEYRKQL